MNARQVVDNSEQLMQQYLEDLKTIVNIDSGTYTRSGVDRVGARVFSERRAGGSFV